MSIYTISMEHLARVNGAEVSYFDQPGIDPDGELINKWLSIHAPMIDYIVTPFNEYLGALIHHIDPPVGKNIPHVWTDTRARRTYCEHRGEIVSIPTACESIDDYFCECFHAGPDW